MKPIIYMFLGIILVPNIFCQLWARYNISPLPSVVETTRTPIVAQESSPNKESGEIERLVNINNLFADSFAKKMGYNQETVCI